MTIICRRCGRAREIPESEVKPLAKDLGKTELCQQCEPPFVFNAQTAQEMILRIVGRPQ